MLVFGFGFCLFVLFCSLVGWFCLGVLLVVGARFICGFVMCFLFITSVVWLFELVCLIVLFCWLIVGCLGVCCLFGCGWWLSLSIHCLLVLLLDVVVCLCVAVCG